jgi:hypothetical protein
VAGGDGVAAEHAAAAEEVAELGVAVAADARVGRPPLRVLGDEVVDHVAGELALHVEDVVRDAQPVGHALRVHDPVQTAARLGGAVSFVGVLRVAEGLHGGADDVVPLLHEQRRRHRRIHAAGHGDEDGLFGHLNDGCGVRSAKCVVHRSGSEVRGAEWVWAIGNRQ